MARDGVRVGAWASSNGYGESTRGASDEMGRDIQYVSTICAVAGVGAFSCYSNQRREAPQLLAVAAIERGARDRGTALFTS